MIKTDKIWVLKPSEYNSGVNNLDTRFAPLTMTNDKAEKLIVLGFTDRFMIADRAQSSNPAERIPSHEGVKVGDVFYIKDKPNLTLIYPFIVKQFAMNDAGQMEITLRANFGRIDVIPFSELLSKFSVDKLPKKTEVSLDSKREKAKAKRTPNTSSEEVKKEDTSE